MDGNRAQSITMDGNRAQSIVHLDIDYFFAQVEERRLRVQDGRPLGVQQNMEVASVNYAARARGLFNRISVAEAKRRCPELLLVRGDNGVNGMARYRIASQGVLRCVMAALDGARGVPLVWDQRCVEQPSFDDFFVRLPVDGATAEAWAARLRESVMQNTGLRCSMGVARTKLLAMLATKQAKRGSAAVYRCDCGGGGSGQPRQEGRQELADGERALLAAARVDAVRGAGLVGLRPATRTALRAALGADATLGDWLAGGDAAAAVDDSAAEEVRLLLRRGCDGSEVGLFKLPHGLSVECSVRPSDREPATESAHVRQGWRQLAPLLLSRRASDERTFGKRQVARLVVKWKLFPGAKQIRQAQAPWPPGADADGPTADELGAAAAAVFEKATAKAPYRISRIVLALTYTSSEGGGAASAPRHGKRAGTAAAADDPKQRKIADIFGKSQSRRC